MNEKESEGIRIGDVVKYNNVKGIVVRIFTKCELVDILACHNGEAKIVSAYTDELTKTGEHLTEMVYVLRYLQREV